MNNSKRSLVRTLEEPSQGHLKSGAFCRIITLQTKNTNVRKLQTTFRRTLQSTQQI
jgi:hypothetical protein